MKKQNTANLFLLVSLALIMAFFSLSYIFIEEKSFSEDENRSLQTFPKFTPEKFINGTYTHQLHNYFSDQINLRNGMIEIKANTELLMCKHENNGILLGRDGYLIETHQYTEENYLFLNKNLNKMEKLIISFEENGITSYSVIIPRKIDVLQDYIPPAYSIERSEKVFELIDDNHILFNNSFKSAQDNGLDVFYKTDHHWTAEGAYWAYKELGSELGYIPYDINYFSLETLSSDFYGTNYSKSGFFFVDADEIKAPSIESGRYTVTVVDTETEFDTLYDRSYLEKKDKYSTFLSGNNAHVKIYDTQNLSKETLLIIKDSYSHSLAPYLCEHYNIELIDPRYYSGSIEEYVKENNIKNVLFLFGLDTLASANLTIR